MLKTFSITSPQQSLPSWEIQQIISLSFDSSVPPPRKVESTYSTSDLWEEDIHILPCEPTREECTMEQLDEYIGSQFPIETI